MLPVVTYAIYEATRVARLMRPASSETLEQGYIVTARQKGLSRREIIRGHVVRNSILPVITVMGYSFGTAMGGAVLIETVFSWPGVGLLMVEAIRARDTQVIVVVVLFVCGVRGRHEHGRRSALRLARSANSGSGDDPTMTSGSMLHRHAAAARTAVDGAGPGAHPLRRHRADIMLLMAALAVAAPWFASSGPLDLAGRLVAAAVVAASAGHRQPRPGCCSVVLYAGRASLTIGFCAARWRS